MERATLTTFEHQTLPIGDAESPATLSTAEAEHLSFLGELRPGLSQRGHRSVRMGRYCGVLSLGNRVLEVLPKIDEQAPPVECRGVLLRLLRQSGQVPFFRHLLAGQHLKDAPLLEVFISTFFDAVAEIVRGGLLRLYRECENDVHVVRGRILANRQFSVHANRPDRIACRYDEMTADHPWNRVVKAGLWTVRPWMTSSILISRWTELVAAFEEVADAPVDVRTFGGLVFDRHSRRYRAAINWARWLLLRLSPSMRAGEDAVPGLMFDTDRLFESAVASVLQRRCGADSRMEVGFQDTTRHLASLAGTTLRAAFRLRPDLVVRDGGTVVAVGDTKWKRLQPNRSGYLMPNEADVYQMHAYASAFRCEDLALIYPWHRGLAGAKETSVKLPEVSGIQPLIRILCVDVNEDEFRPRGPCAATVFARLLDDTADTGPLWTVGFGLREAG
jgi:5-methylcytosine-specific restriction enzyme subunit McrC